MQRVQLSSGLSPVSRVTPLRQSRPLRLVVTNAITSNDFKNGMSIEIDGQPWRVVEFLHVKPGKGSAFVRTKLKVSRTPSLQSRMQMRNLTAIVRNASERAEGNRMSGRTQAPEYIPSDGTKSHDFLLYLIFGY